ncbi:MAG: flagellar protein FlaG [Thermomicrobium sp.]|nr:flagellar protein FlaG [Thermomicrobium sp.]MCX7623088.1 flagellar protein FlaG [Thermomicrobium sp.]
MNPPITPVPPVGPNEPGPIEEVSSLQPVKPVDASATAHAGNTRSPHAEQKRDAIPAHRVDLSLDPQLVRKMPRDVYLRYYVRPGIGNWVVQLIDRETQEVIREIPPGGLKEFLQQLAEQRDAE